MHRFLILQLLFSFIFRLAYTQVIHLKLDHNNNNPQSILDAVSKTPLGMISGNLDFVEDRFGNGCRALQFSGKGYLKIPHSKALNFSDATGFTASAWLKLPDTDFQIITLICKGEQAPEMLNSPAYRVQLTSQTVSFNSPSTRLFDQAKPNLRLKYPKNKWFHFCFTYSQGSVNVYVNGKQIFQNTIDSDITQNTEALNIGRDAPGATEFFVGIMDDLRIYRRVLGKRAIQKLVKDKSDATLGAQCSIKPPIDIPEAESDDDKPNITFIPEPEEDDQPPIDDTPEPEDDDQPPIDDTPEPEEDNNPPTDDDPEPEDDDQPPIDDTPEPEPKDSSLINELTIYFDAGSHVLNKNSTKSVDSIYVLLKQDPKTYIHLEGHTSDEGRPHKNNYLSKQRVEELRDYLNFRSDIDQNRIKLHWFGETRPVVDNSDQTKKWQNRRVVIRVFRRGKQKDK